MTIRSLRSLFTKLVGVVALASTLAIGAASHSPASASVSRLPGPIVNPCVITGVCPQTVSYEWIHHRQGYIRVQSYFPPAASQTVYYHLSCSDGQTADAYKSTGGASWVDFNIAGPASSTNTMSDCTLSQTVWRTAPYPTTFGCADGQFGTGWHAEIYFFNDGSLWPSYC